MERKRAVAAIVENNDRILMGKKRRDSSGTLSGEWHFPGETIEGGETDQEAIIRGLQEEAGVEIKIVGFIGSHLTPKGTLVNWYLCRSDSTDLIVGSDLEEVCWVAKDEVLKLIGEIAKSRWPEEVRKIFEITG